MIMRFALQNNIAITASTFPHGYKCSATDCLCATIAHDYQYCTNVFIMRCVQQNKIAMNASTFSHGNKKCSAISDCYMHNDCL